MTEEFARITPPPNETPTPLPFTELTSQEDKSRWWNSLGEEMSQLRAEALDSLGEPDPGTPEAFIKKLLDKLDPKASFQELSEARQSGSFFTKEDKQELSTLAKQHQRELPKILQKYSLPDITAYYMLNLTSTEPSSDWHKRWPSWQEGETQIMAMAVPFIKNEQLKEMYNGDGARQTISMLQAQRSPDNNQDLHIATASWLASISRFNPEVRDEYFSNLIPPQKEFSVEEMSTLLKWHNFGIMTAQLRDSLEDFTPIINQLGVSINRSGVIVKGMGWNQDSSLIINNLQRLVSAEEGDPSNSHLLADYAVMALFLGINPPLEQRADFLTILSDHQHEVRNVGSRLEDWGSDVSRIIKRIGYTDTKFDHRELLRWKRELAKRPDTIARMDAVIKGSNRTGEIDTQVDSIDPLPNVDRAREILVGVEATIELRQPRANEPGQSPEFNLPGIYEENHQVISLFTDALGFDLPTIHGINDRESLGNLDFYEILGYEEHGSVPLNMVREVQREVAELADADQIPWAEISLLTFGSWNTPDGDIPLIHFAGYCKNKGLVKPEERKQALREVLTKVNSFVAGLNPESEMHKLSQPLAKFCQHGLDNIDTLIPYDFRASDALIRPNTPEGKSILTNLTDAGLNPKEIKASGSAWVYTHIVNQYVRTNESRNYVLQDPLSPDLGGSYYRGTENTTYRDKIHGDPYTQIPIHGEFTVKPDTLMFITAPAGSGKSQMVNAIVKNIGRASKLQLPTASGVNIPTSSNGEMPVVLTVRQSETTYEGSLFSSGVDNLSRALMLALHHYRGTADSTSIDTHMILPLDETLVGTDSKARSFLNLSTALVMRQLFPKIVVPIVDHNAENGYRMMRVLQKAGLDESLLPQLEAITVNPATRQPEHGLAPGMGIDVARQVGFDQNILDKAEVIQTYLEADIADIDLEEVDRDNEALNRNGSGLFVSANTLAALDFEPSMQKPGFFTGVRDRVREALNLDQETAHNLTKAYAVQTFNTLSANDNNLMDKRLKIRGKLSQLYKNSKESVSSFIEQLSQASDSLLRLVSPSNLEDILKTIQSLQSEEDFFAGVSNILPLANELGIEDDNKFSSAIDSLKGRQTEIAQGLIRNIHNQAFDYTIERVYDLKESGVTLDEAKRIALDNKPEEVEKLVLNKDSGFTGDINYFQVFANPPENSDGLNSFLDSLWDNNFGQEHAKLKKGFESIIVNNLTTGIIIGETSESINIVSEMIGSIGAGIVDAVSVSDSETFTSEVGSLEADQFPISFASGVDIGLQAFLKSDNKPYFPQSFQLPDGVTDAQVICLNGSNFSGKTEIAKLIGLTVLQAKSGGVVPAQSVALGDVDELIVEINPSNEYASDSTFMAEARRMSKVVDQVREAAKNGRRPLVIIDEPFNGIGAQDKAILISSMLDELTGLGARVVITNHEQKVYPILDGINRASGRDRIKYLPVAMQRETFQVKEGGYGLVDESDPFTIMREMARKLASRLDYRLEPLLNAITDLAEQFMIIDDQIETQLQQMRT